MKNGKWGFGALVLCALLAVADANAQTAPVRSVTVPDPRNATFLVEGKPVALHDGQAVQTVAPGAASVTRTRLLGMPAYGDVDGDGDSDVLFFLVQEHGGSGAFHYVVVAYRVEGGYRGGNGVLLGDRIAPQRLQVRQGLVVVDYLDRGPDEPMAAQPRLPRTTHLRVEAGRLLAGADPEPGKPVMRSRGGAPEPGTPGLASSPQSDPHALWLGRKVLAIAEVLRDPQRPDALATVRALGHDSRYYLLVRGWLRMQLDADMSILQAAGDAVSPQLVERIAFVQRAIRHIDLE